MSILQIEWNPSQRHLKQFAGIWFPAFLALLGAILWYRWGLRTTAITLWSVGAVLSAVGFFVPAIMRWVWIGVMLVTFPIGWVVSHVLMVVIFFGIFTPVGLIMRLVGYDPMCRKFDPQAETYWVSHKTTDDKSSYFRQF